MGEEDGTSRLRRRMVLLRTATLGAAAPALAGCVVAPPGTSVVYAPGPARTGISDADPSDAPGHGRGGYVGNRVRTGLTDADPSDGPGYGRGGYRGVRRVTDTDPSDAPGRGRGW
jgi:hypothetical protein